MVMPVTGRCSRSLSLQSEPVPRPALDGYA